CSAAPRTSARRKPQVRDEVAGRVARWAATRAVASPATSVSMCPASARSARLPVRAAPTSSATRTPTVTARTTASRPRCCPTSTAWAWGCPGCDRSATAAPPLRRVRGDHAADATPDARSGREADRAGLRDRGVAVGGAGQQDDLHLGPGGAGTEHLAHLPQPVRVGVAEGVVEHDRHALVGVDQPGHREPGEDAELLLGAAGELLEGDGPPVQGAGPDHE